MADSLFSFRIVREQGHLTLPVTRQEVVFGWQIFDAQDLTFRQVWEELDKCIRASSATDLHTLNTSTRALRCTIGRAPGPPNDGQASGVSLDYRVKACERFGTYVTFFVKDEASIAGDLAAKAASVDAFTKMMSSSRAISTTLKRPPKHVVEDNKPLRGDFALENDVIDWLGELSLGFRNGMEKTAGKELVQGLRSVFFELTPARLDRLKMRSAAVPDLLCPLVGKHYKNPAAHHHKGLAPLTQSEVGEMSAKLLQLCCLPPLQSGAWRKVVEALRDFAAQLEKYKKHLASTAERMNKLHHMMEPARTPGVGQSSSVVRKEGMIRTATVAKRYAALEKDLTSQEPYQKALSLVEYVPADRKKRYKFVHELELPFAVELYSYHPGDHGGTLWWIWRATADVADADNSHSMALVKELEATVRVYRTRAMRRDFVDRFGLISHVHPAILNEMYRFLTGDASVPSTASSKAVQQRLTVALDAQDDEIAFDLRELNEGRPEIYNQFWDACQRYIEEQALQAVDDRRHGRVVHMACAISTRDFIAEVSKKLPAGAPVPSEAWVRFQFSPKNTYYNSSAQYSGRLEIKRMVQSRQLSHTHPDAHYAAAVFKYLKSFAVMFRDVTTLVCQDDKHVIKVGEPAFPVAAVDRGKSVLVGKDVALSVGHHDFTKVKLIPSVDFVIEIPEQDDAKFFQGQVVVKFKEATFQPSSALRHAAELCRSLKSAKVNTVLKPILAIYTDGGPDHRLTYGTVQISLILLFRQLNLDYLIAARTCPTQSYKNPVERVMSFINLGLQCIGLMRTRMPEDMEALGKNLHSTGDIREAARKNPGLKASLLEAVQPTKSLVEEFVARVRLHDQPFICQAASTEDELDELWEHMKTVDESVQRSDSTKAQLNNKAALQAFMQRCCTFRDYFLVIKKCGAAECNMCGSPSLPAVVQEQLHRFPDPVLEVGGEHFKKFQDVWGTETSQKDQPSLQLKHKTIHASSKSVPESEVNLVKEKVRSCVDCVSCQKPRCIFSQAALTKEQETQLQAAKEEYHFSCGGPLVPDHHALYKVAVVRSVSCCDDVEQAYYSSRRFPKVCYKCGASNPLPVPEGLLELCQSVHPLCNVCTAAGHSVRTRKKSKGRKRKHAEAEVD